MCFSLWWGSSPSQEWCCVTAACTNLSMHFLTFTLYGMTFVSRVGSYSVETMQKLVRGRTVLIRSHIIDSSCGFRSVLGTKENEEAILKERRDNVTCTDFLF